MHYERFSEKESGGSTPAIEGRGRATRHRVFAPHTKAAKEQKQNPDYMSERELGSSRFGGSATNTSLCPDPSNYDNDMLSHSPRHKEQPVAGAKTRDRHTVDAENDGTYPCDSRPEFLATRQRPSGHMDCVSREDEDLRRAREDSLHSRTSRNERFSNSQMKTVERQGREFSPLEVAASGTGKRSAVGQETRTDAHTPVTHRDSDVSSGPSDGLLVGNRGQEDNDDLADLPEIDDIILLQQVEKRFRSNQPYTYIGDTLVAVNPCRDLSIYTQEYHDNYSDLRVRCSLPAHIFWVADQTYRNMLSTTRDQCVVVGGESGAGKTESTKLILKHLVYTERHHQGPSLGASDIISRLETVSPLLEIFGNAATTLNENSSRFGKLVELEYDDRQIKSARIEGFLLEKYRVTNRIAQEKNFHVFYALLAGLPPHQLSALNLADVDRFRILSSDDPAEPVFTHARDKHKYRQLYQSMETMLADIGFTATEVDSLLKVLSAILLISNVEFRTDDVYDTVEIVKGSPGCCLDDAADVLGLPQAELETCLLQTTTEVNRETIARNKDERQARTGRDALARELYSALFYGAIDKINARLRGQAVTSPTRHRSICLLDISGFENGVGHNGFEQFVINSTNEKLHQYFLQHTFEEERREYEREGLSSVDIDYVDNAHVVNLIFKKPNGLIPLLEDQSTLSGTSAIWLDKCRCNNSAIFNTDLRLRGGSRLLFEIKHYAGQVVYSAEHFVQKNTETLPGNLRKAVQRSDNPFIRDYFSIGSDALPARNGFLPAHHDSKDRVGKLSGCFTDQFKTSLSRMMSRLSSTTPIFIRCIKPNQSLTAGHFDRDLVRVQLRHSGLVEVAMVRKYGYPIRIKFSDFVERYGVTCDKVKAGGEDSLPEWESCQNILQAAGVDGYQLGRTKVFLKLQHRDKLEDILKKKEMESKDGEDSSAKNTIPPDELSLRSSSGFSSATSKETLQEASTAPAEDGSSGPPGETNNEGGEAPETMGKQPAYDIFRLTERDYENSKEFEMKVRRIVRFILYILLALILLAAGLTARLALIWLATPLLNAQDKLEIKIVMGGNPKETEMLKFLNGLGPARLLACQLLPLLLGWIACCFRVIFGRKDWPTFKALIVVFIIDCMGTVGRSVFLFKVLPTVNILTAVCLGTAVCQVPAILKLASLFLRRGGVCALSFLGLGRKSRRLARVRHVLYVIALVLAVVVQLGTIPLLYYGDAIITLFNPPRTRYPCPSSGPFWW
ncbi:unconventional myosin-IXa-like [Pomacea canaliculata]|uniref:unconventional myosin-IXa-like n=1 Tax=Pomacea canaliculata TaxID=400727 RepID=UPI000D734C63|nr:unconventional myosin-IXa-like [Pomacea canaliculata]